jgi:uroporphyrin-III C-methyltransferase/precorrin-2 dehydrogenase/sirohydrochlorin ferrochelatase
VGGGEVALRKGEALVRAGARLHVVAPSIAPALVTLAERSGGEVFRRAFASADVTGKLLVVAATDESVVNRNVHAVAVAAGVLVNVVDAPELCTYIVPSIIDRSPLVIALSSGGNAPVLLRLIRERLEQQFPASFGWLAELAGSMRGRVKQAIPEGDGRRRFWERVLDGPVADAAIAGRREAARQLLEDAVSAGAQPEDAQGEVWLVGAGPGDPDLLTLRALRLMQRADVVFHDNLVSPGVLDLVRRDAERIYVGKRRGEHAVPQARINEMLVEQARAGRRALRLKGGDPFVFGRGGEEIATLRAQGIPFQVVPGITAANGCAAYAGIPLTHRDHAQSVRFVTGHLKAGTVNLSWPELAEPGQTLVIYMGLVALEEICMQLIAHGRAATTPVAMVEAGTLPEQRVIVGTLATIAERVRQADARAPTLVIIGEVVRLRDALAWRDEVVVGQLDAAPAS